MKFIGNESKLQVYSDDEVRVLEKLPVGNYQVKFSAMGGYYLRHSPSYTYQKHLYGGVDKRVHQVLSLFHQRDRNLGAILTGTKGMGKTVFSKQLSVIAYEEGLPTLIVDEPYPGMKDFLNSITQPVIVQFDEFEKNFLIDSDDSSTSQQDLLNLFDGTSTTKKLFIITGNAEDGLSKYILNRPGRFHYHFRFDSVTPEIVRDYFKENLKTYNEADVETVAMLSDRTQITYDYLNAIAVELNLGAVLKDALNYLNIDVYSEPVHYTIEVTLNDGSSFSTVRRLNLSGEFVSFDSMCNGDKGLYNIDGRVSVRNIQYDPATGLNHVNNINDEDFDITLKGKDEDGDTAWLDVDTGIKSITLCRYYKKDIY